MAPGLGLSATRASSHLTVRTKGEASSAIGPTPMVERHAIGLCAFDGRGARLKAWF